MLSTLLTIWLLHMAALITPGANMLLTSLSNPKSALGVGLLVASLREARR